MFIKSNPAKGLGLVLSGIITPAFITSTELLVIETGLSPVATITLRLEIKTMKNSSEASIIPVIVASV
jgi:hypothetical protein